MKNPSAAVVFPLVIESPSGMAVELNANGSIRRLRHGDVVINLFPGSEAEGGPCGVFLRQAGAAVFPLTGSNSGAALRFNDDGFDASGRCGDLVFRLRFVLSSAATAWFWHVEVENTGQTPAACDLFLCQDAALAHYGAIRLNEHYVSQYVDHTPLDHPRCGTCVASRQNQSMGGSHPWMLTGSLGRAVSYATDALQVHGFSTRAGETPAALLAGLPGSRLQHEHSMVSIQNQSFTLAPGEKHRSGFFAIYQGHHPDATSAADAAHVDPVLALPEAGAALRDVVDPHSRAVASWFTAAPFLDVEDADDTSVRAIFGEDLLDAETGPDGRLLSFFTPSGSHVVLRRKELRVLRPHGHILRSGGALVPDESALTSTAWMGGVFHSMVTQGHVSINRFLSTCHSYLGLFRSHGQRVFIESAGRWVLLGIPSAFEISHDSCRWIYQHAAGVISVRSTAPDSSHRMDLEIEVCEGAPCRFLITHHVAMNGDDGNRPLPAVWRLEEGSVVVASAPDCDVGWRFPDGCFKITPASGVAVETVGGDELLYPDAVSRNEPFVCMVTAPARAFTLAITGHLVEDRVPQVDGFWKSLTNYPVLSAPAGPGLAAGVGRIGRMLPWLVNNALVHYLSPRGLEQYSGGGWGTRDVCQGAVELLLGLGRPEPVRDLLLRVFRQQNPDGDWPQWFMFFERERGIRPGDSHGDIVFWPLLALAQYLDASGDAGFLDFPVPFFHPDGNAAEIAPVRVHMERALEVILARVIPGTCLAAYGHGDWNDALQPVRAEMRDRLCSSWTVTLNYQTFVALAAALKRLGLHDQAAELDAMAGRILGEFQQTLIVDGTVAGYAWFAESGTTDLLIHPNDPSTGLSYSLLPMIHAIINDMFTPEQARHHLKLVETYLTGPDGAHLFDRPMAYRGGPQTLFQRAESASYFGREIGIMYTHAHLRYCEALARHGDADAFFHALSLAVPIGIRELAPSAALRQSNCYYSSSDPAFADRYQAHADYHKVGTGDVPLEGGWRVYSSGAGIGSRLIRQCLLGLREECADLVVDPVIPPSLDGLSAKVQLEGSFVDVLYRTGAKGAGPLAVQLNGVDLGFSREENRYRLGGVRLSREAVRRHLRGSGDRMEITLD